MEITNRIHALFYSARIMFIGTLLCAVPVCIRSDLIELWLAAAKDHVHVGHVKKEELHKDGRGRIFP